MSETEEKLVRREPFPRHLIGLTEAADLLLITPSKLYRLAKKEGIIRYVQYGPHSEILFEKEELIRFFEESTHGGNTSRQSTADVVKGSFEG